jgi:Zn-dependent protease with chaperone function
MGRPRTVKYVISPKELMGSWLVLYLATFALQLPCAAIRAFVAYPPLWLAFKLVGQPTSIVHDLALVVGYGPLAYSIALLVLPLDGWWWEQSVGGRVPSEREQLIYEDAIEQLRRADPKLRVPRKWFVIDEEIENAAACGDTVMITRGLLDSGYLEAALAHELGHLNSSDARITAALNKITTPPYRKVRRGLNTLCFLATGAIGMWPLRAPWSTYWRSREHKADQYAANLGQAEALSEFLDARRAMIDLPIPFIWLTEHSHPPTEHRVERLMRAATQQPKPKRAAHPTNTHPAPSQ